MTDEQSVLFVEDEDLCREMNADKLKEAGYGVVVVGSGNDALEALDNDADPFCVLVTDINLGRGANGWHVGKRARELDGELPVIYMTGGNAHEWSSKGVTNSVLLEKPFKPSQLIAAIARLLKKVIRRR